MNKDQWLCSDAVVGALAGRRDNDVKVRLRGIYVPVIEVFYDHQADMHVIVLDEECDDYRISQAADVAEESACPGPDCEACR